VTILCTHHSSLHGTRQSPKSWPHSAHCWQGIKPTRFRESRSCLQSACNCQYNCCETLNTGSNVITSPASLKMGTTLFSYLCQCGLNSLIWSKQYTKIQFLPRRKHCLSIAKTNRLTLFREIIAVNCDQRMKHNVWAKRRDCGCYAQFRLCNTEAEGAASRHWRCTWRRNNAVWSAMTSCQWPLHQRVQLNVDEQDCCLYTNIASLYGDCKRDVGASSVWDKPHCPSWT
jgi:hypothetical protein